MSKFNCVIAPVLLLISITLSPYAFGEPIKIGITTALTGPASSWGVDIKNAVLFANEKLGKGRYELVIDDDQCDPKSATAVAQRFIAIEKLRYVLGVPCSGPALATLPLFERAKIPTIVVSASAAEIAHAGDYIFRTWPSDAFAGKVLAQDIATRHHIVGIISETTDYAESFERSFVKTAPSSLRIEKEEYDSHATEVRSQLQKLRARKIEALFINSQDEGKFGLVLRQVREMGWPVPVYGAYWPGTNSLLKDNAKLLEGVRFVDLPSAHASLSPEGLTLYEEFVAKYGKMNSVELVFASTFEGYRALTMAIESGEDPRAFLYKTHYKGLIGEWYFDADGEIQGISFVMKEIRNGRPVEGL